jgi:hypothetical protein
MIDLSALADEPVTRFVTISGIDMAVALAIVAAVAPGMSWTRCRDRV